MCVVLDASALGVHNRQDDMPPKKKKIKTTIQQCHVLFDKSFGLVVRDRQHV
jgi:hypothetical protein